MLAIPFLQLSPYLIGSWIFDIITNLKGCFDAFDRMCSVLVSDLAGNHQLQLVVLDGLSWFAQRTCLAPDQSFLNLPQNVFRPEKLNNVTIIHIH